MPQDVKAFPTDPAAAPEHELAPPVVHEKLHGLTPAIETEQQLCDAIEKAFDYRGDVTLALRDGTAVEGYIFDREAGPTLGESFVRLFPKDSNQKVSIRYSDIARLVFSGRDTAEGKSFETWVKKYNQKKAAGEKDIRIDPESLD